MKTCKKGHEYSTDKKACNICAKEYYQKNFTRIKEQKKEYYKKHIDKFKEIERQRRQKKYVKIKKYDIENNYGEIWKDIPGYIDRYKISNHGRVLSLIKQKIIKQRDEFGYKSIGIYDINKKIKRHRVHRLVLLAFLGESSLPVNHKDGIKSNNKLENLEYCTTSENNFHKFRMGLDSRKSFRHNKSKFTEEDILKIKQMIKLGVKNKDIALEFNVDPSLISHIRRGYTHA